MIEDEKAAQLESLTVRLQALATPAHSETHRADQLRRTIQGAYARQNRRNPRRHDLTVTPLRPLRPLNHSA